MASLRLKVIHGHLLCRNSKIRNIKTSATDNEVVIKNDQLGVSVDKNRLLSKEEKLFYEENGYLVKRGLMEENILEQCRQHFVDICEERAPKGSMTLMKDISLSKLGRKGEYLYNKVQDIVYDPVFENYVLHNVLLDYVESFIGPNIKAVHSMLINKPPDPNTLTSRHPLHQDLYYFPFRPADKIVAVWTAMESIKTENGCLLVLPGSHRGPLLAHAYPKWKEGVNKAYHGIEDYDKHQSSLVPLHMEAGDTVFFHPLLIHGSGPNLTKGFRKAISCHYAASDCYYIDVKGTIQEPIANEIIEMAKKRGNPLSFTDIWRFRSRLVRGEEGTL